ncbi:MAG: D-alanyl-D-alanine carboxypeptidase [Oscillospiraceae bacterium]|nr:D-alanyl-D-alanine carboxypeptidase [Oscillospiraceae bacterium]
MKKPLFFISVVILFLAFSAFTVYAAENQDWQPSVSAASAILINADTGAVIFEKNSLEQRAMASTTKIMTTLLTLEAGELDRSFTVDSFAIRVEGSSMGLREGDIVTRRALCYGMMLPSGNDAAQAAAVSVAGSLPEFVKLMNDKAVRLGLNDTSFANPSGLDAYGHYSTAYDLAILTMEAMKNREFSEITARQSMQVNFGNPPFNRWLYNNNRLLYMYNGTIGTKTGFTDNAGRCLVSAARRDGVTLIAVTLNAPNDWRDHSSMFDYGFSKVRNQVVDYDLSAFYVNVIGGETEKASLALKEPPTLPLSDDEMRLVEVRAVTSPFIYAGFEKGERVGNLLFYYNGRLLKTVPLVTSESTEFPGEKLHPAVAFGQFWRRNLF